MAKAKTPPHLRGATSAFLYFDPRRAERYAAYTGWTTVIKHGDVYTLCDHESEAAAHAYLGLEGGCPDREYRPLDGSTGHAVAIEEVSNAA